MYLCSIHHVNSYEYASTNKNKTFKLGQMKLLSYFYNFFKEELSSIFTTKLLPVFFLPFLFTKIKSRTDCSQ